MQFSSGLLENAVNEFSKLPGIGKKTAIRLVLHLLKQDEATETIDCYFSKNNSELTIHYRQFDGLVLAWVIS